MTADAGVEIVDLNKSFRLYERPFDRLREFVSPTRQKYGREFWAVKNVSFKVPRGATLGLVGDNGAGKSTILKMIAGKLRPTSGSIQVRGAVSAILELGTGLQPALSGRLNARLSALFLGYDPWTIEAKLDEVLDFAELGEFADQPLETYSTGMKARLAFSVLVGLEPEILILDEALATGDVHFGIKCKEFLRGLCRSGCTALIASHDMEFMADVCDELVWLERGEVKSQGDPTRAVEQYLGAEEDRLSARPRNVLLKFEAPPGARLAFDFHCLEWLGAEGGFVHGHYPGERNDFVDLLARARQAGMTKKAARSGWGEAGRNANGSSFRSARAGGDAGSAFFLALPVPAAPDPLPHGLQLGGRMSLEADLEVSMLINGAYVALGSFGTPDGAENEDGLGKRVLDVSAALAPDAEQGAAR